jgi:hypothetical protein
VLRNLLQLQLGRFGVTKSAADAAVAEICCHNLLLLLRNLLRLQRFAVTKSVANAAVDVT